MNISCKWGLFGANIMVLLYQHYSYSYIIRCVDYINKVNKHRNQFFRYWFESNGNEPKEINKNKDVTAGASKLLENIIVEKVLPLIFSVIWSRSLST